MVPTLEEGDIIAVSKLSYKLSNVKRNDVVVVNVDGKYYVKRIIGLPGEDIKYIKNVLYINDVPYTENFLDSDIETSGFTLDDVCKENECPDGVIPENKYLVLGDNRPESEDSRDKNFGLIDISEIKGKVIFRIWPLNSFGKIN
jgi:signal peptidase I